MTNWLKRLFPGKNSAKKHRGTFSGSDDYWKERYQKGRNSGAGSYNQLAQFKAEILNRFVAERGIESVIEYGCGDGNQLRSANYPQYTGFDISGDAIALCREIFAQDTSKSFHQAGDYSGETAELTLSLDVLYHLVEDEVFDDYMRRLFDSAGKYVIIYSSNTDDNPADRPPHVRHRKFSTWVADNAPQWQLVEHIPNRHPYCGDTKTGSFADFYIYATGA